MSNQGMPPAGWYPDPDQPGIERWWDGQAWHPQTRPVGAPPPPPSSPAFAVPIPAGPGGQPSAEAKKSGCFGIGIGVMFGIIGAIVLLLGGCVALLAAGSDSSDLVSVTTSTTGDTDLDDAESAAEEEDPGRSDQSSSDEGSSEADDVVSCTRAGSDSIVLEVVNNSPKTSSYLLTVGYFDEEGNRLADEPSFVNYLRPGERAIEEQFVFEEQGTSCEVIDVDRFAAESFAHELAEISECEIGAGPDALGSMQASVTATNGTPEASDYAVDVAFVDAEGIRRGTGTAFIEAVRPDESAPSEIFSTLDFAEGYTCDVVAVTRNAS